MNTNIHVHTPFSFSAFSSIKELVATAAEENVSVLGINDLNTTEGFKEFSSACRTAHIYPVFNIEFKVENDISKRFSNDAYPLSSFFTGEFSGKALPYPQTFPTDIRNLIASIWKVSQDRIWKIIERLNTYLSEKSIPITLDYTIIRSRYARTSVYEQHIACALADNIRKRASSDKQINEWYEQLFATPPGNSPEVTIVHKLLSEGTPAFVSMANALKLTITQVRNLILQTGGIPCYQCRLAAADNKSEHSTSANKLADYLENRGIFAIEFLPQFSNAETLKKFMNVFTERQFCVSIGTGHCTTTDKSTLPFTSNGKPLGEDLCAIGYRGACIFAAHQEHRLRKQPGFLDEQGNRIVSEVNISSFIDEGNSAIIKSINHDSSDTA